MTRRKQKRRRGPAGGPQLVPAMGLDLAAQGALGDDPITRYWPLEVPLERYHPAVRLEDGTVGYCMSPIRHDDCLRPSIATVLQVSVEQVPDARLDERLRLGEDPEQISRGVWARLDDWLAGRGLRFAFHDEPPVEHDRWVGVVRGTPLPGEPFQDHCLVMSHRKVLLNPMVSIPPPPGMRARPSSLQDVAFGITFDNREEQK